LSNQDLIPQIHPPGGTLWNFAFQNMGVEIASVAMRRAFT